MLARTTWSAPAQDIISLLTPPAHHELRRLSCSGTSYEQDEGENDDCEFEDSDGKCYAADLSGGQDFPWPAGTEGLKHWGCHVTLDHMASSVTILNGWSGSAYGDNACSGGACTVCKDPCYMTVGAAI